MKQTKSNFSLTTLALAIISACCLSACANASCIYQSFQGWKDCFIKDVLSTNLNSVDLEAFQQAQFVPRVIELDRKQPEKTLTLQQYFKIIGIDKKIADGRNFYTTNRTLVDQVAGEYGVEPTILVAILALESHYGTIMGKFNVIDSLSTLSYEGRRREFFQKELVKVLQIARNENLNYDHFHGSWAGAMGQIQFMPSSYLAYAVDYDGDGKADIWYSTADALASAANYLKSHGWKTGSSSINQIPKTSIIASKCGSEQQICTISEDIRLIFLKDDVTMDPFQVGRNFEVLMKWNRSLYFGIGVLNIAKNIEAGN